MTDQEYQEQDYTDQQQQSQETGRPQSSFDSDFSAMISGAAASSSPDAAREAWVAYFDLAEQTLRTARRVTEVQTLSLMRQQIVNDVTRQVISAIRQNPQLVQRQSSQSS